MSGAPFVHVLSLKTKTRIEPNGSGLASLTSVMTISTSPPPAQPAVQAPSVIVTCWPHIWWSGERDRDQVTTVRKIDGIVILVADGDDRAVALGGSDAVLPVGVGSFGKRVLSTLTMYENWSSAGPWPRPEPMLGSASGVAGSNPVIVSVVHTCWPPVGCGHVDSWIPRVALMRVRSGRRAGQADEEDRPGSQSERYEGMAPPSGLAATLPVETAVRVQLDRASAGSVPRNARSPQGSAGARELGLEWREYAVRITRREETVMRREKNCYVTLTLLRYLPSRDHRPADRRAGRRYHTRVAPTRLSAYQPFSLAICTTVPVCGASRSGHARGRSRHGPGPRRRRRSPGSSASTGTCGPALQLICRNPRQIDTETPIDVLHQPRAVKAVRLIAAPDVGGAKVGQAE